MNILITGIHGFVGTNLVNALKAKHTIYGLDIVAPQKEGAKSLSYNLWLGYYSVTKRRSCENLYLGRVGEYPCGGCSVMHSRKRDVPILGMSKYSISRNTRYQESNECTGIFSEQLAVIS